MYGDQSPTNTKKTMRTKAKPTLGELSEQEARVAELIAWGASKKEAAETLFVEYTTIDSHIQSIYKKLHVNKLNGISAWYFSFVYEVPEVHNPRLKRFMAVVLLMLLPVGYMASLHNGTDMIRTARMARASRTGARRSECEFELV